MSSGRAVLSLAGTLILTLGVAGIAQDRPDLSGTWTLNVEESDDLQEQMQDGMLGAPQPGQRGGRRPGIGGGWRPGGQGGFGRGGGGLDRERVEQTMQLVREGIRHLSVTQNDSMVTITYANGNTLALRSNGKKTKLKIEDAGDIEIKARWKRGDFIVERKVSGGGTIKETYLRPSDREQLYVIVEIELGPMARAMQFRRVYEAAGSS